MQFWHVLVTQGYNTIFDKQCLDINEANALLKLKREEYPFDPQAGKNEIVVTKQYC